VPDVRECLALRVPMADPGDASGIHRLIADGRVRPGEIVAIFGKTEGNGGVNDFTRALATEALKTCLARHAGVDPEIIGGRVPLVMSGGTEGGLSPHFLVIAARAASGAPVGKALAVGTGFTRPFLPEEIGRAVMVSETATAVRAAIRDAQIASSSDVHFVQIKCPLLTGERVEDAKARGQTVVTEYSYPSMGYSRGAAALGIAVALDEIAPNRVSDESICADYGLWSARASTSAGVELTRCEIIVLGNSAAWSGRSVIAHGVMKDAIDLPAVHGVLRELGFAPQDQLDAASRGRIRAVLAKAEASRDGRIRGARHIMLDDSDINATRHARALVGGVLAGTFGFTDLYVSGGAEHQGPSGGGPIAVIADRA
jgi:cyanuric acid amidohydrolase